MLAVSVHLGLSIGGTASTASISAVSIDLPAPLLFGLFLLCFRTLYVGNSFVLPRIVAISLLLMA